MHNEDYYAPNERSLGNSPGENTQEEPPSINKAKHHFNHDKLKLELQNHVIKSTIPHTQLHARLILHDVNSVMIAYN